MKTFFLSLLGALAALIITFGAIFMYIMVSISSAQSASAPPTRDLVLTLDLRQLPSDQAPKGGLAVLGGAIGFIDILHRLDAAETDDAVKGVYIRGAETGIGSSRAEELRAAIKDLREAGKFVLVHSQGNFTTGPSGLRAIAAADEIWMQPGTALTASGVVFETLFMKDLFDNLSITADIEAFYEYKNAPNTFKESDFTEPHREAMTALAQSFWTVSLSDIAEDRGLTVGALRTALESGPKSAETALELNLVDKLGWPEEALEYAKEQSGGKNVLAVAKYKTPFISTRAPAIAIVGGEGPIITGGASADLFQEPPGFASDAIASAILKAGRNEDVKAIVFRVDSPGGSPTASDQIWRAVERVQEMGKPVVVSMSSVAASGGYYVSTGADYIIANRSTITGSIGIFGGKYALADGLARIGVNVRAVSVGGDFADAFGLAPFTDTQRQQLVADLQRGYDRFTSLVAEGRNMTVEEVHAVAKGRVWTGEDALEVGLVDELGGFEDAINKARELADIADDQEHRLIFYPESSSGFPGLEGLFSASADAAEGAAILGAIARDERLQALVQQTQALQRGESQALGPVLIER